MDAPKMRTFDDIAEDYAHARTPEERASLVAEQEALRDLVAIRHRENGHVSEYQQVIGYTHRARS